MVRISVMRTFAAVVRTSSIREAARALGYSPSAVSRQIAKLQRELGVQLFEPEGRGILPTRHAVALERRVRQLLAEADQLDRYLNHLRAAGRSTP